MKIFEHMLFLNPEATEVTMEAFPSPFMVGSRFDLSKGREVVIDDVSVGSFEINPSGGLSVAGGRVLNLAETVGVIASAAEIRDSDMMQRGGKVLLTYTIGK